jgi:hypothetical protein
MHWEAFPPSPLTCQVPTGAAMPADFDYFEYREREFVADPARA